jgi:hypothetical protein
MLCINLMYFITAVVCIKHIVAYRPVAGQGAPSEKRDNGCCSLTVGKHINNIRDISR